MGNEANNVSVGFGTPFEEQIDFLRKKLRLPSERWTDIQRSAHDRAFMVSGAAQADLLHDLHQAVLDAAKQGAGLEAFKKDFLRIVQKHGWAGWTGDDRAIDPATGLPTGNGGAGVAWRLKIIYSTNMSQSYWAGRYRQMTDPDMLAVRPYWRYIHSELSRDPRPHHMAWHGLTLKHDHPFWQTHFAPNGWGCKCRIEAVSKREGEAAARAGLGDPPDDWDKIDSSTGTQVGIDKGFNYAPGASVDVPLRKLVQDKLITYPPAIGKALAADVNRYINTTQSAADFVNDVLRDRQRVDPLWLGFVEDPLKLSQATTVDTLGFLVTLPAETPRHVEASHGHDGLSQRMAQPDDYAELINVLNAADDLRAGDISRHGNETVVATKKINGEVFRAVFEVLTGKKNRALALLSLVIKTKR